MEWQYNKVQDAQDASDLKQQNIDEYIEDNLIEVVEDYFLMEMNFNLNSLYNFNIHKQYEQLVFILLEKYEDEIANYVCDHYDRLIGEKK